MARRAEIGMMLAVVFDGWEDWSAARWRLGTKRGSGEHEGTSLGRRNDPATYKAGLTCASPYFEIDL